MTSELKETSNKLRVAVIGAGASGITSTKTCLEYGFEPVCFEMSDSVGGLWRFTEKESHSSVYRSTIINSSKEMGSFSDFPLPLDPAEWPTFLHHSKQLEYFNMYVDHFQFRNRIRFNTKVHQVTVLPPTAGSTRVRWQVVSAPTSDPSKTVTEEYDAVMVCIGHHSQPRWPNFPGQDTFKGEKIHSHAYKDQAPFVGKNVLVVGIGNSGVDVAVETCRVAKKVYLSTRSGAYILNRLGMFGLALDHSQSRFLALYVPQWIITAFFSAYFSIFSGDLERFGLKPAHGLFSAHPTVNGELLGKIATSEILARKNVSRFTESGVVFEDDPSAEVPIDSVVFCTGYKMRFPFLPQDVTRHIVEDENKLPLYRYVYLPESRLQSIGFIGYIQPLGSIMPIAEMQARWFCQVLSGQTPLPDEAGMKRDIAAKAKEMGERYKSSPRHTIQVDYVPYVEEIARDIGCAPSAFRAFFSSPKLAMQLLFGPAIPQVYRVTGPHSWAGAPKAIDAINRSIFDTALTGKPLSPPPPKPWWQRWPVWFAALALYLAFRYKKSREMLVVYG